MQNGARRVLVVEDDPDLAGLVALTLESEGYEVHAATNGAHALAAIERHGMPGVILLDIMMPVMDGFEFARQFRRRHDHGARIVVMTAASDASARAAQVQADGWIGKPFELEDLIAVVARHATC
ncbi:MAG TPA: response regulator [Polyangia bacterium]|jgi:urea transport system substrate-binding protein